MIIELENEGKIIMQKCSVIAKSDDPMSSKKNLMLSMGVMLKRSVEELAVNTDKNYGIYTIVVELED